MFKILKADEKKYALLLTTDGKVEFVTTDGEDGKILEVAREKIGCEWIECVYCSDERGNRICMMIDEEGKLKEEQYMNPIASWLYETCRHGDPIVGNAMLVLEGEEDLEYMNGMEVARLAKECEDNRAIAYELAMKFLGGAV